MTVGAAIKRYVSKHGLSQNALATSAGIPRQALTRCIRHGQNPSQKNFELLLAAMDKLTRQEKVELLQLRIKGAHTFRQKRRGQGKQYRMLFAATRIKGIYKPVFHCDAEQRLFPKGSKRIDRGRVRFPHNPYRSAVGIEVSESIAKRLGAKEGVHIGIACSTLVLFPEDGSKMPHLRWASTVYVYGGKHELGEIEFEREREQGQWSPVRPDEETELMRLIAAQSKLSYANVRLGLLTLSLQGLHECAAYYNADADRVFFSVPKYFSRNFSTHASALESLTHAKKLDREKIVSCTEEIAKLEAELSSYEAAVPAALDALDAFISFFNKSISRLS